MGLLETGKLLKMAWKPKNRQTWWVTLANTNPPSLGVLSFLKVQDRLDYQPLFGKGRPDTRDRRKSSLGSRHFQDVLERKKKIKKMTDTVKQKTQRSPSPISWFTTEESVRRDRAKSSSWRVTKKTQNRSLTPKFFNKSGRWPSPARQLFANFPYFEKLFSFRATLCILNNF